MRQVIVPGTFDYVHEGHIELIDIAYKISDFVIVLINSDDMILERKPGLVLSMNQLERFYKIRELYPQSPVLIVDSIDEIKEVLVDAEPIILHGDDYDIRSLSKLYGVEVDWWKKNDIIPLFCHRGTGVSSTKLREKK